MIFRNGRESTTGIKSGLRVGNTFLKMIGYERLKEGRDDVIL